jgi:hypothetical protein
MGDTPTLKSEDLTRLTASRELELDFIIKGRHLYLSAEGSLSKVDWQLIENVVTVSDEELVG